jgi:hypothetical protein
MVQRHRAKNRILTNCRAKKYYTSLVTHCIPLQKSCFFNTSLFRITLLIGIYLIGARLLTGATQG